jgi:cohesin loading factor subunit SCC2
LFGNTGLKAKDAVVRGTSIDLLGMVAAHLKQDAVACSKEKFWILQELEGKRDDDEDDENAKKNCTVCGKGNRSKVMVSCNSCNRWFHGDCIGVTKHDLFDRGWLCHCCLCRQQLASLRPDIKVQATGVKESHGTKLTQNAENSADRLAIIHQTLLNYLQEMAVNDSTAIYARRFYLCQWLRDEEQSMQTIQFFRNRCTSKVPLQDFDFAPLSRDAVFRISRALGQQRPLARGFDKILERLLVSLTENSPTPRAKALRAVSAVVEADPGVLGDERVQRAVEGRFLDSAISVREAAMELVGHHIVTRPDFAVKYFEKIAERIMDTGVSVRKRVIKIIRDVCMSNSGFTKATDGCVRIISRINDEESSIQDLVGKTFFELWFEEPVGHHTQFLGDGSAVPLDITEKVQQLVDVLRRLPGHQPMVTIIKRSLALDFCPQNTKNTATSMMTQAAVRHRCELMCKCLLESVLKVEETAGDDTEICALPYIVALHAFCTVDPTLCAPPSDPARFAVTLQPYLKTQVGSRDAAQLLQSIVFVIDTVLPLLRRPPQSFVEELERDLRQLISTCSFLAVVHACIKYFFEALKPSKYFATSRFCIIHGCDADLCPDEQSCFYCFAFVVR